MPTITHAVSTASTTDSSSYSSGTFTPAAGDMLVVFVIASGTTARGTMTDSNGVSYANPVNAPYNSSTNQVYLFVSRTSVAGTSTSVTFTLSSGSATGAIILVERVSGILTTSAAAIQQTATTANAAAGTTPSATFSSAVLSANATLGAVGNLSDPPGLTAPASWTALGGTGYTSPTTGGEDVGRNSGFSGTTITWGSTSATAYGVIIVELNAATSVSPLQPTVLALCGVGQ
jgi:hypothetical protein